MKCYLISLLFVSTLFAGTYDDLYTLKTTPSTVVQDQFLDGSFLEIKRFNSLDFSTGTLSESSEKELNTIIETIEKYTEKKEKIKIKIIGHTSEKTDRFNPITFNKEDSVESLQKSDAFAHKVAKKLEDNNISKELLYVEYRGSKDMGFISVTQEGKDLSNRVMVTIYVNEIDKIQEIQEKDSDADGVFDSKDECPNTPSGVKVDEKGCPFDSDKDGVLDYKDECPDTMVGLKVNEVGCPISMTLSLNFKSNSSEILGEASQKVLEFAKFLEANPAYNLEIIGHTDNVGTNEYNNVLSLNRAKEVETMLLSENIDASRIKVLGKGEGEPVATNETTEGRAINRRIEVKLFN